MVVSDLTSSAELAMLSAGKHFPVKLTKTNFLVWRRQVQSTLVGIDLLGFVDGTITAPAKFLDPACTKPNPAYTHWYRQDQILLGALLGSCSNAVQPLISLVDTAHDAWSRLNTHLASMSRGRIISLKAQLNKNPRGNRSIEAYISDMTIIDGDLALAGSPVAEEDLVVSIMTQLGDDYQAVYQSLRGRGDVTLDELSHILTDCELQLPAREAMGEFSHIPTANFVRQGPVGTGGRGSGHGGRQGRGGRQCFSGPRSSATGGRSGGRFCNFCNLPGHDTRFCRKLQKFLRDNNCDLQGSGAPSPTANVAASSVASAPQWLLDSGASHHTTNDVSNLNSFMEYGGPDEVRLGNGKTLAISHTSSGQLSTPTKPLSLSKCSLCTSYTY